MSELCAEVKLLRQHFLPSVFELVSFYALCDRDVGLAYEELKELMAKIEYCAQHLPSSESERSRVDGVLEGQLRKLVWSMVEEYEKADGDREPFSRVRLPSEGLGYV